MQGLFLFNNAPSHQKHADNALSVSSPCGDKGYVTCMQWFCGSNVKISGSLGVLMRLLQPTETEVEEEDNGLWIRKIKMKTKLRKLLQTWRVFYSRRSVAVTVGRP
jgi:hypothetical protein